ncbi:MAG: c-type cytochrome [Burkholderiales bacterium]
MTGMLSKTMRAVFFVIVPLVLAAGPARAQPSPALTVAMKPPAESAMPDGPLGELVRLGRTIVVDTQRSSVKPYLGNGLNCVSCHLDAGRQAYAAPLVGLWGVFPEYRSRTGRVETLTERVNDCFRRSMNGRPLPPESREMTAVLAYIQWLSFGVPTGIAVDGRGFIDLPPPARTDPARGKTLFAAKCASCHGANGQGTRVAGGGYAFPPLWGPASFNTGAGMARETIAAAFIMMKMPLGQAGTLTADEAYDIAAYVTRQPRPEFAAKKSDWPKGGKPKDVPY